eukprot:TRINITY_DN70002_c0_g1_i1.p1 TRINITY_DN70002_c0_g1~~TRINITY_DN70002_c0_g1_i1.p1  ORF type:complete len:230 (+),score=45.61 TRINITY_DN70002_c0_g1_i1:195-884(+)
MSPKASDGCRRSSFFGRASIQDPFAVLGLQRNATSAKVKRAYHALARQLHPDKDRSVAPHIANARFQRVKAAYEVLSDPAKRKSLESAVISAPFRPAAAKKPRPVIKKGGKNKRGSKEAANAENPVEVLDSDEEQERERAKEQASPAARKRTRLEAEKDRRFQARTDAKARAVARGQTRRTTTASGTNAEADEDDLGYCRLVLRPGAVSAALSAKDLEVAFSAFGARAV